MMRFLPWALAAACLVLGASGFGSGPIALAARGVPGLTAAFFFMLVGRLGSFSKAQVAQLGGQLFYVGGALAIVAALVGVGSFAQPRTWWLALPLSVLSGPLLAVATLRLSTAAPRKGAYYGVSVAFFLMAVFGAGQLFRLVAGGALPF